jgi:hypothetical protein
MINESGYIDGYLEKTIRTSASCRSRPTNLVSRHPVAAGMVAAEVAAVVDQGSREGAGAAAVVDQPAAAGLLT